MNDKHGGRVGVGAAEIQRLSARWGRRQSASIHVKTPVPTAGGDHGKIEMDELGLHAETSCDFFPDFYIMAIEGAIGVLKATWLETIVGRNHQLAALFHLSQ